MTAIRDDELTYLSFPIKKFEEDADGNLVVYGTVTDGTVDSDRQIVDPEWSAKALTDWMDSGPNLRVMHSPHLLPAGRGLQVELGDTTHMLKALVVEDQAKKLVRNKVLRAYSVGITQPVIKRDPLAPGGRIVGGTLAEVSLVDRPANKNCQLVLAKSAEREIPWTYGDLDALLSASEPAPELEPVAAIQKIAAPSAPVDLDRQAYDAERAAWLAREPVIAAPGTPPTGTAFLAKMAARDAWHKWDAEGDSAGYTDPSAGYVQWLGKRDVRPEVGGGVDVDAMPGSDFIDPKGRRFPIHSPGDVSDAVSSYGRAKPLIPMATFRRRLRAIARRKGPEFEAQLPESWDEAEKTITTSTPLATGLVPFNLQGAPGDGGDDDDDKKQDVMDADLTKRRPYEGQRYTHGWVPVSPEARNILRRSGKPRASATQRLHRMRTQHGGNALADLHQMYNRGASEHDMAQHLTDRAHELAAMRGGMTAADMISPWPADQDRPHKTWDRHRRDDVARLLRLAEVYGDGGRHKALGALLTKALKYQAKKGAGGAMSTKTRRLLPPDVKPAGMHREPDGDAVEELEEDAGMPTTPDDEPDDVPSSVKGKKGGKMRPPFGGRGHYMDDEDEPEDDEDEDEPDDDEDDKDDESASTKGLGDPYTVKRVHDATCAAYDWPTITNLYPAMTTVRDALTPYTLTGPLSATVKAVRKAYPSDILDQARDGLYKSFTDMYPTARPQPTHVTPGMFQRPYITAGHAPLNAAGNRVADIPPATHTIHPDQFDRGLITAGHQAESPSDRGNNLPTSSVATGSGRANYATASAAAAANAMKALHDHIADTVPGMCPMSPSRYVMPADMQATARPVPTNGFPVPTAPGEVRKGYTDKDLRKAVKTAVAKATAYYEERLAAMMDEIGAQPDPAQAPFRGVVRTDDPAPVAPVAAAVTKSASGPQDEQIAYVRQFLTHPSPATREQAHAYLRSLGVDEP